MEGMYTPAACIIVDAVPKATNIMRIKIGVGAHAPFDFFDNPFEYRNWPGVGCDLLDGIVKPFLEVLPLFFKSQGLL